MARTRKRYWWFLGLEIFRQGHPKINASCSQFDRHISKYTRLSEILPPVLALMMLPGQNNKLVLYEHHNKSPCILIVTMITILEQESIISVQDNK